MGCQNAKGIVNQIFLLLDPLLEIVPLENVEVGEHIMISYSWNFRTQIPNFVFDELAKRNYRVWMDKNMGINSNMNRE